MVEVDYLNIFEIQYTLDVGHSDDVLTDILNMALCLGTYSVLNALYRKARHEAVW